MPRIRSIKPEFWTDGTNLELSDSCALFFIGLWNFCDDEGKHPLDLNQLVAELGGRWHRGKVRLFVSCLVNSGQLRINSDTTWIQVVGWSHQKIDKPRQPKIKSSELQWLDATGSAKALDSSRDFGARIGSDRRDRIGSDHLPPGVVTPVVAVAVLPKKKPEEPITNATWEAYSDAYLIRHKVSPVRNRTVNGKLAQFVKRIGQEEAPAVAEFYVRHNDQFYVRKLHPVGLMLQDAEKLRTEWATGRQMTSGEARHVDRAQTNFNAFDELIQEARQKEQGRG